MKTGAGMKRNDTVGIDGMRSWWGQQQNESWRRSRDEKGWCEELVRDRQNREVFSGYSPLLFILLWNKLQY